MSTFPPGFDQPLRFQQAGSAGQLAFTGAPGPVQVAIGLSFVSIQNASRTPGPT